MAFLVFFWSVCLGKSLKSSGAIRSYRLALLTTTNVKLEPKLGLLVLLFS